MGDMNIIGKLVNRQRMINHIHTAISFGHKVILVKPELWERNKLIKLSQFNTSYFVSGGFLEFQVSVSIKW